MVSLAREKELLGMASRPAASSIPAHCAARAPLYSLLHLGFAYLAPLSQPAPAPAPAPTSVLTLAVFKYWLTHPPFPLENVPGLPCAPDIESYPTLCSR